MKYNVLGIGFPSNDYGIEKQKWAKYGACFEFVDTIQRAITLIRLKQFKCIVVCSAQINEEDLTLLRRNCLIPVVIMPSEYSVQQRQECAIQGLMQHTDKCGHNIVGKIKDSGVPVVCCGQKMTQLIPGTVEASVEKHIPVARVEGNLVTVQIGAVEHPMIPEHYIPWVYLQTATGGQRKNLEPGSAPAVTFALTADEKPVAVYAYCNLHGLWKADL